MPRPPAVYGPKAVRALERTSFEFRRQVGSHAIPRRPETRRTVSVPSHGARNLPPGTLASILRDAGLSADEFVRLLG